MTDELIDQLRELLPPEALLTDATTMERFNEAAHGPDGAASVVVRPADSAEVADLLRWALRTSTRVLPQGANSGLVGASVVPTAVERPIVVLSTERLVEPLLIDPVAQTATVGAGVRLSTLNDAAAAHGLELPIDLGADPSVGGMVATNTGGARMLRNGDVRSRVLGLEAVLADRDTTVLSDLRGLRKDNSGLAIEQLLVGASGALGVVTAAVLELSPRPEERSCAWLCCRDSEAAQALLVQIRRRHCWWLSAFEVCSTEALRAAASTERIEHVFGTSAPALGVLAEFAGPPGAEDALVRAVIEAEAAGLIERSASMSPDEAWRLRHSISEGLASQGTVIGCDVSVPIGSLGRFRAVVRDRLEALLGTRHISIADFGHWGDGGLHVNVVLDPTTADDELRAAVRSTVTDVVVSDFGGSFSAEHGIGPANATVWRSVAPTGERRLSHELKRLFDPDDTLGHPGLPF